MSDWTDLRLAHSLAPVQAPDALWARINAGSRPPRPRWQESMMRMTQCVAAAAVLVLLVGASAVEMRPPQGEFVANAPVAPQKRLAHQGSGESSFKAPIVAANDSADAGCKTCHTL